MDLIIMCGQKMKKIQQMKKNKLIKKNRLIKKTYKEELVDLSAMTPLEGNEEVKEGKGINILTSN